MWVLSDIAYAEIYFDGQQPPSILQVEGAKDLAIEFNSLSKTYIDAGLAHGVRGRQQEADRALARIKSYLDYGAYTPIQVAATAALNGRPGLRRRNPRRYKCAATCSSRARRAGWHIPSPPASMFAWAPIPEPFASSARWNSPSACCEEAEIAVSPGIGFGEYGEGHVRIALVENEQRIRQAARNVVRSSAAGESAQNAAVLREGAK